MGMDAAAAAVPATPRKSRWWLGFIISLLLALLGVALWTLFRAGGSAPPPLTVPPPTAREERQHREPTGGETAAPAQPASTGSAGTATMSPSASRASETSTSVEVTVNDYVWNYWLTEAPGALVPQPAAAPIALRVPRHLLLRLSAFDLADFFDGVKSLQTADLFRRALAEAIADPDRHGLDLDILVQSPDQERLRIEPAARHQRVTLDLDAQRAAMADPGMRPRTGTRPDERLLRAARLADIPIDFTVLAPGTHEVGIAVVDAASGFPLQTMVAEITAGAADGVRLRGNGRTAGAVQNEPADLALYLFDLGSRNADTIAHSLHAQLYYRDTAGRSDFVAWRADVDLEGLRDAAHSFESALGSSSSGATLLQAGADFGRLLFGPGPAGEPCAEGSNCAAARKARAILRAAAAYGPDQLPPTMLVRVVSGRDTGNLQYASDIFPFGAMGVARDDGGDPLFLGERFALALVLSDQQFTRTDACPGRWYVSLPRAEDHGDESDPLGQALRGLGPFLGRLHDAKTVQRQSDGLEELRTWLTAYAGPGERSYVLVYLGHHDDSHLYLREGGGGVSTGSIQRLFERASIAILDACSSAMSRASNGTLVGRLARQHVDSTIATTSKISGQLAADYIDCLGAVLDDPRRLSVGQAHALATQCLWSDASSARWQRHNNYRGAALKYILIGDPHQPICSPNKETP